MKHFQNNLFKSKKWSGAQTPLGEDHPYYERNDHVYMAYKSRKVNNPVAFAQNLKRDLGSSKFNNTPESQV